eukprot:6356386-Prymnesium_polylepis.1
MGWPDGDLGTVRAAQAESNEPSVAPNLRHSFEDSADGCKRPARPPARARSASRPLQDQVNSNVASVTCAQPQGPPSAVPEGLPLCKRMSKT